MFVMTTLVVILMQIKWGENTLEQKASLWIKQGTLVISLKDIAQAATKKVQEKYDVFMNKIKILLWKSIAEEDTSEDKTSLNNKDKITES